MEHESAGRVSAEIANAVVRIFAESAGRGATRSRAFIDGDVVVCVLEDVLTRAERLLADAGRVEQVRQQRDTLQRLVEPQLTASVEQATGRTVRSFLSGSSTDGTAAVEVFLLEPEGLTPPAS